MKQELILMIILGFCVYFYLCAVFYTWIRIPHARNIDFIYCIFLWPLILAVADNGKEN